ncbi:MAG: VCBS repeat-containing protein [Candidatus Krumholzibacteriota bacterium]|nr:VCBS repeat-containing protein [Candidatus Krumholzibacteriota bacterium]
MFIRTRRPDEFLPMAHYNYSRWKRYACTMFCACFIAAIIPARSGNAQTPLFSGEPAWFSAQSDWTWSVATGDVNGDGYLDLVCGNSGESSGQFNTLYLNDGGILSSSFAWSSAPANMTLAVALGDIDGDGALDLVCGNYGQRNTIYLNSSGMFTTTPSWYSDSLNLTSCVTLGDIDNDGYLDLVCGNGGYKNPQRNTLYMNEDGIVAPAPVWQSDSMFVTNDIAIGDVNGDGYLDLVCGNDKTPNTLYLNEGGMFSTSPAWLSDSTFNTTSVELGDINGDGYLDLVCANIIHEFSGKNISLYLNEGGLFSTTPSWSCETDKVSFDIALGDIDGDGDLDLVCANIQEGSEGNVVYLNTEGTFPLVPDWTAESNIWTIAIALGDIDSDGSLDMICGNAGNNAIYSNNSHPFAAAPDFIWPYFPGIYDIDMGDIDGNGYPDLVAGGLYVNLLFLNNECVFDTLAGWYSSQDNSTANIDLGDVDGDGDLDLVCGNVRQNNTLYLNQGGTFSKSPDWNDGLSLETISIALEDVDLDGDLDLISGTDAEDTDTGNALFLNDGGVIPSFTPAWFSAGRSSTGSIALGDINKDGYPDLVCGNFGTDFLGEKNTMYLNDGGIFTDDPVWYSSAAYTTVSIALGDIDSDGDLDLVCGNCGFERSGQANTLYLNEGGVLASTPEWVSGIADKTFAIALEDLDRDGDLDLICGNSGYYPDGENNTIYLNNGGTFSSVPDWTWERADMTTCVFPGDVDLDGDIDVIFGNSPSGELFLGKQAPAFKGSPLSPTNHLPNNSAFLRSVDVREIARNRYLVTLKAIDVESDQVWIVPEYQFEGMPEWYSVDVVGSSGKIGPLTASPEGIEHQFDWDVSSLPFDDRDIILRLKTISDPKRVSLIQQIPSYMKNVGPIEPSRPELTVPEHLISFPTITVGDTTLFDMTVLNTGNELLSITGVSFPSTEIRLGLEIPVNIDPGGRAGIEVFLEPRIDTEISGPLMIESNDPLTPVTAIQVETDIRALRVESNLLTPTPRVPLGEAVTVVVSPFPDVRIEQGYLHHRPGGNGGTFNDSIPLSKYGDDFIAVVPGTAVTEGGLEYYIKIENSGVYATDPPGAPDSFFTQAVDPPGAIFSYPKPNSGAGFLEGRPVRIEVSLPDGAVFSGGLLHYRIGGRTLFDTLSLEYEDPLPVATIADTLASPRGLEYWVEVNTLTRALTDPPLTPDRNPYAIQIMVQDLREEESCHGSQYRMISIPLLFDEDFYGTIEALLADQAEFGPYDPINWRSFRYTPDQPGYMELSQEGVAGHFRPEPGRAFWLVSRKTSRITTSPITGYSTPTGNPYSVALAPGWNMIGNPFNFPVAWDSILVDTLTMAESDTIVEPPIGWEVGEGYSYDVETLAPFEGYWVRNLSDIPVILNVPPLDADAMNIIEKTLTETAEEIDGWMINIVASCSDARDRNNFIGVYSGAENHWDRQDRSEPPLSPGNAISLYFPHPTWERHSGNYSSDIRGGYAELEVTPPGLSRSAIGLWGQMWKFDIAKNFTVESAMDEVLLEFEIFENVPVEAVLYLIDRDLGKYVDLRTENRYDFYLGKKDFVSDEEDARFVLLVGSEEFIDMLEDKVPELPVKTVLHQNYPNPLNPSTVIRYEIAEAGKVVISIYDVRGSLIKTLYQGDRNAGIYEIGWDGKNSRDVEVTSGIYFYRLKTGHETRTRKMILLR